MEEAITALLATVAGGRRYWVTAPAQLPDGSPLPTPYVVMYRIDGLVDYTITGPSGYVASRVQVDVYGDSYTSAKETAREVVTAVSGHRDHGSGESIQGIFVDSMRDTPAADAGEVTQLFRVSVDIIVHHIQ